MCCRCEPVEPRVNPFLVPDTRLKSVCGSHPGRDNISSLKLVRCINSGRLSVSPAAAISYLVWMERSGVSKRSSTSALEGRLKRERVRKACAGGRNDCHHNNVQESWATSGDAV